MTPTEAPVVRRRWRIAAAGYAAFIIYGSLLPFQFRGMPLDTAWRAFLATPYLNLGVGSRADWVANGLLYLPLGALLTALLVGRAQDTAARAAHVLGVLVLCLLLAFGLEFMQLFFPPRTVSQNDLVAEALGSAVGVAAWLAWGGAAARLWHHFASGGVRAARAAAVLYALGYLGLSLFPFDLLISIAEFANKLREGSVGWLLAPSSCSSLGFCVVKLAGEALVVVPAGLLLGLAWGRSSRSGLAKGLFAGALLGLAVELSQLFIASGISQGMSVATRAVGVASGLVLYRRAGPAVWAKLLPWLRPAVALAALPYLAIVAVGNGWSTGTWRDAAQIQQALAEVHWLPLYHHYFTTETLAVVSVLFCVVSYSPVGMGLAAWRATADGQVAGGAHTAAWMAGALAVLIEAGKLAMPDRRPDPTNVLIAMAAAAAAFAALRLFSTWVRASAGAPSPAPAPPPAPTSALRMTARTPAAQAATGAGPEAIRQVAAGPMRALMALALLAGSGVAVANYPLGAAGPSILLAAVAALLWRFPRLWLSLVLAALPALNFMPSTGWVLVNEFDMLLAVTVAVVLLRPRAAQPLATWTPAVRLMVGLLALSFGASALVGLLPLSPFGADALSGYFSGYNALRILKGFTWPLLLWWLLRDEGAGARDIQDRTVVGILIGLCVVIVVSLWQRAVFGGLLSFSSDYRIEGPFPELHTGGGDLHAHLVLSMPFAAVALALWTGWLARAAAAAVLVASGFVLAVTFTRGAYVGGFGALAVAALAILLKLGREARLPGGRTAAPLLAGAGLLLAAAAISVPLLAGNFMQARMSAAGTDAKTRFEHWAGALALRAPGAQTAVLGMGLGSFPRSFLVGNAAAASATVSVRHESGETFARLGAGRPTYFGQHVAVRPGAPYTLSLKLRGQGKKAGQLDVALCEKSEQYSFNCQSLGFTAPPGAWQTAAGTLAAGQMASGRPGFRRPVVLTFANSAAGTVLDIDDVRLTSPDGRELVVNGSFAEASSRWFFAADDHLPWHIFSLPTQVLFEMGWLGVLTVSAVMLMALARQARRMWRGDLFAGAVLAALVGFLLVGITESLFDGPRVMVLFFLLLFIGLQGPAEMTTRRRQGPGRHRPGHPRSPDTGGPTGST